MKSAVKPVAIGVVSGICVAALSAQQSAASSVRTPVDVSKLGPTLRRWRSLTARAYATMLEKHEITQCDSAGVAPQVLDFEHVTSEASRRARFHRSAAPRGMVRLQRPALEGSGE